MVFLMECRNQELPVECKIDDLLVFLNNKVEKDSKIKTYTFKIKCFDYKCKKLKNSIRNPALQIEALRSVINNFVYVPDESAEFDIPPYFYQFFEIFMISNKKIGAFDEAVTSIGIKKYLECQKFESFVGLIMESMEPENESQKFLLRSCIIRLFFDRLYLIHHEYFVGEPIDAAFVRKCDLIIAATPKELLIKHTFIRKRDFNQPFKYIAHNNEFLREAIEMLYMVQFYSNPVDITGTIFRAFKCVEKFAQNNALADFKEDYPEKFEQGACKNVVASMALDEFINIAIPVLSMNPPANSHGIASLLSSIQNMKVSQHMEFAFATFVSVVDLIDKSTVSVLVQSEEQDENMDPLEINSRGSNYK